jgi:ribosomal protein S12 methylthiotransferase
VGFPGETEVDFREMLDLLEEIRFERVGAFAYSPEEDTPAATRAEQVPEGVRRERLEELLDLQRVVSLEKNLDLVGSVQTALVDRVVDDDPEFALLGHTEGQAIDVDGVTWIQSEGTEGVRPGEFVHLEIVDGGEYDLIARLVV